VPKDWRRTAAIPEAGTDGQRECAREAFCTGYRLVPAGDGTSRRAPGLAYQAFCAADTALITARLHPRHGLPAAYWWLRAEIGSPVRRSEMLRVPFGPRMPLSEYYDLLMRRILEVLCSWEDRVREAARLSAPAPEPDPHKAAGRAAKTLADRLSVLFARPAEPMVRHIPSGELRAADSWRASSPVLALWQDAALCANADGMATIRAALPGPAAGIEILDLHARCLTALGQIAPPAEVFDGIPCRVCGTVGLERAEPPPDPAIEADWSRCPDPSCGDRMKLATYRQWVTRYSAWAQSLETLTCRRCEAGNCAECVFPGCECAGDGHREAA
jgi:hypothetical protein